MNKADVIRAVSEKTGIDASTCEKIINAFEQQAGDALVARFKGISANLVAGIAARTGISPENCQKVLTSLQDVVGGGIVQKINFFFKNLFAKP
jgi:Bacterial DNA-binding protein